MPKRDRQPEHWGSLLPHNSMHGRRPVPLSRPTVVIGKGGDVRAPSNPHLSRCHIRLEREGDGSVYATHLSALNSTWLNGKRLEHDRRTLVEPCAGNAPYSLSGEAPDAPLTARPNGTPAWPMEARMRGRGEGHAPVGRRFSGGEDGVCARPHYDRTHPRGRWGVERG